MCLPLEGFVTGVGGERGCVSAQTFTPGAYLGVWKEFFPLANIFGGDLDHSILFREDRIETFGIDQTDPAAISEVFKKTGGGFDLIVDDGLHEFNAGRTFFENAFSFLSEFEI